MSNNSKKYGPEPLAEEEKRLSVTLSISNKTYPRLRRLRSAFLHNECHEPTQAELEELIRQLAYRAIDAYCEQAERDEEVQIS